MASDPTKPLLKLNTGVRAARARGARLTQPYPPSHTVARQKKVLGPKFTALQGVLAANQNLLELRTDPDALAPECLLVFELKERALVSFTRALQEIEGLELVGEGEAELEDDEPGYLYLLIPSEVAIRQMLALWTLWSEGRALGTQFRSWGKVFECLHDLRRWGPKDRVTDEDAQIIADMARFDPNLRVRLEIELVFDARVDHAARARDAAERRVAATGGRVLHRSRIDPIAYDAILVDVSGDQARQIANRNPAGLAGDPEVFAIRPQKSN